MSEVSTKDSSTVPFSCLGQAERGLTIEVKAEPGDHDGAEKKAQKQAEEQLEELGIDPEKVTISFDEIIQEEGHE